MTYICNSNYIFKINLTIALDIIITIYNRKLLNLVKIYLNKIKYNSKNDIFMF